MSLKIVNTKYGILSGVQKIGYSVFRGVPYAKPPVGSLRWKKPRPPEPWPGVRDAKVFASRPIEEGNLPPTFYHKEFFQDEDFLPPISEDCLYLNVWTPAVEADAKLPVAFWIHGGAFINGFSSEMEFDGAAFAGQQVILVTVGHRLGAMGYLAHPWLSAEQGGRSGNYGLYDLIAALDYVQENIAAFGGDPSRVMVFGQSAGGRSTQFLISSKLTRGKIHRAVIQSGGGYHLNLGTANTLAMAEDWGKDFVERTGAASLEALRAIPAEDLLKIQMFIFGDAEKSGIRGRPFAPAIDGELLDNDPDSLLERGAHLDIPYMLGCTANDLGNPPEHPKEPGTKPLFYKATVDYSILNESLGRKPAYIYYFTRRLLGDDAGAFHSAELWYVFGTLSRSWRPKTPEDYALSEMMVEYWCNFAKQGDPNGGKLPQWAPCTRANPFVKVFE
ncbi:MAG: carboxylesterase family protein [Treponema sp.]|nr:carboxylesterase family protein [Treponema sp.]